MSEDTLFKLTRSSSGPLRLSRRPPLNKSANSADNKSAKEDTVNTLVKEFSNNDSMDDQSDALYENENLDLSRFDEDDSTEQSEEDRNYNNDRNESDESDSEYFEGECGYTEKHNSENAQMNSKDITDFSTIDSFAKKRVDETKNSKSTISFTVIGAVLAVLICCCIASYTTQSEDIPDLSKIKKEFPTQHEGLWINFESGVEDVTRFNRPSTFIFLYKKEAENTLEKLLNKLANYAVCKITDCSKKPIIVTDAELNSSEIVDDYGRIIVKYKKELQQIGMMIIKNLENIPGVSAQAFHSFCDEINPLVYKSLFIFTMRVDESDRQNKMEFVAEYLKNKWTDIKTDTFNALITRISSMVLEVKP